MYIEQESTAQTPSEEHKVVEEEKPLEEGTPKPEESDSEEEKYWFEDLASNDIFFSCVYNQYCRKPGTPQNNYLSEVS